MNLYKKNYDVKRIQKEQPKKKTTRFMKGVQIVATIVLAAPTILCGLIYTDYAEIQWTLPKVFASEKIEAVADKETEEEALERRTQEILFEDIQEYYDDARKKALAEKVDALNEKIDDTTEITPEQTDELKAKLKRGNANLVSSPR